MRIIAGLLLIVAFVIHLLLGVGSLLSSKYEEFKARTDAEDLASVAGDLVDEETLAKERKKADQRADTSKATLKLSLGIILLGAALTQALGAVLLFVGRGRGIVATCIGLSIAAIAVTMILSGTSVLSIIGTVVLVLALALSLSSKRASPKPA